MLNDDIRDIRLYDYSMGLPAAPTANCFSDIDENGMLYIADRAGVCSVNINRFHKEQPNEIRTGIRSIECNNEEIEPDENGVYTIPAVKGRITITPAILDYSMTNPLINVFLDGAEDTGITVEQKELTPLEYTDLKYGNYTLHIQVLDKTSKEAFQDATFRIVKKPMFFERLAVRILGIALLVIAAGLVVWRVLAGTIIRRQYEQIRIAKEEADRANSAKSQFLAEMSHEIRTPINAVLGMNEMILRESHRASDESLQKESGVGESLDKISVYSGNIQRAGSNLLSIINDILDFSKIEEGKWRSRKLHTVWECC
jgi:signal transduction histidine kinase